ncbi:hypothetical protein [Desulfatitalea tepidiphila]|uniref:hypothetical protein n=1 Tax=Desulfatitalea tepidiphila TaxID=1185843 RepID=UPI00128EA813|nr:hypothetical protein [Desulfatitalea tepidiphila]
MTSLNVQTEAGLSDFLMALIADIPLFFISCVDMVRWMNGSPGVLRPQGIVFEEKHESLPITRMISSGLVMGLAGGCVGGAFN